MRFRPASAAYSAEQTREMQRLIEQHDRQNHKKNRDVEIGAGRLILTSPNGTRYSLAVDDAGALSVDPV